MTVQRRIKKVRKDKRLSHEDVARHFGITRSAVSYWENETEKGTMPAVDRFLELARFLGVDPVWLLTGEERAPPLTAEEREILNIAAELRGRSPILYDSWLMLGRSSAQPQEPDKAVGDNGTVPFTEPRRAAGSK